MGPLARLPGLHVTADQKAESVRGTTMSRMPPRVSRPHVAPVWFTVDGRDLVFSTSSRSVKARNLNRDPRVAVTVDDETPPFAFVSITGHARLITRPDDFPSWTTRIATRYVGAQRGPELGKLYTEMDDLLVRVHIDSLTARADVIG